MKTLLFLLLTFNVAAQTVTSTTVPVNTNMVTQGKGTTFFNVNLQYRKLANMAALRALPITLVPDGSGVDVLGYYAPGDGGGGTYVLTNSIAGTNAYGGRILAAGGAKSWQLDQNVEIGVKQFGAKAYEWFVHPYYGISTTDVSSFGTGDFTVSTSFEAMASYDLLANGLFRLAAPNSPVRSLEVSGIGTALQILLRSTNGSSSVAAGAATIYFNTNPLTLGASNNLAITRAGTNWLVYVNGVDVTASATISGASELSGSVTAGVSYKPEVGLTSNYQMHRKPIYWLRGWFRTLNSAEVANVLALTDYTWQVSSQFQTAPEDSSEAINAAAVWSFVNGGGVVKANAGKYRIDSPVYLRPTVSIIGEGETDWVGTPQNNSNPSVFWAWDTSETNDVVVFDGQYMTNQYLYLTARDATFGTISNKVGQARVKNVGLSANYVRFGRPVVMRNVANCSVEECELSVLHGYLADVYAGNEVRLIRNSSRGFSLRGTGIRYLSVADSRIAYATMGGLFGPNILLQGANNNLIQGNLNFNAQNNAVGTFAPTLDISTDVFTATNHNFFTGQSIFVYPGTGVLPTQLATNGSYFVYKVSENTFKLSNLYTSNSITSGALQGGSIDFTNAGTAGWTINSGPAVNMLVWNSDGNLITGNRMDQAYDQNIQVSGGFANQATGNGFHMAGWNNTTITNIGNVKLSGGTILNQFTGNIFGKTRASSFARYGFELEGTTSNILDGNISWDVTPILNSDSGTGKQLRMWGNLRGDVVLGTDPLQSTSDTAGFPFFPGFNGKQYFQPAGISEYPWQVPIAFSTNTAHLSLGAFLPQSGVGPSGNGWWRGTPLYGWNNVLLNTSDQVFFRTTNVLRNASYAVYSDTLTHGPGMAFISGGGSDFFYSTTSPTLSGKYLTSIASQGLSATNTTSGTSAELRATATENFGASAWGSKWDIFATPTGSATQRIGVSVTPSATTDDTDLLLWDVTAGTLKRVTRGAADSGGAGFRVLRVAN